MAYMKEKPGPLWNFVVIVLGLASIPWWAFFAVKLWAWFIVPFGLPSIGMAHAIGLRATIGLYWPVRLPQKDLGWTEKEKDIGNLLLSWCLPVFAYVVGRLALYFL